MAQVIHDQLDQFTGAAFEMICREWVWRAAAQGQVGFLPRAVGGWWDDHEEIDVLALAGDAALLGECKWTARPIGVNILDDLRRKAQPRVARHGWKHVTFALFARSGFTPALESVAVEQSVLLLSLDDIVP